MTDWLSIPIVGRFDIAREARLRIDAETHYLALQKKS